MAVELNAREYFFLDYISLVTPKGSINNRDSVAIVHNGKL